MLLVFSGCYTSIVLMVEINFCLEISVGSFVALFILLTSFYLECLFFVIFKTVSVTTLPAKPFVGSKMTEHDVTLTFHKSSGKI